MCRVSGTKVRLEVQVSLAESGGSGGELFEKSESPELRAEQGSCLIHTGDRDRTGPLVLSALGTVHRIHLTSGVHLSLW
jgi:hypothetical protein